MLFRSNIILDTFINLIKNLSYHLKKLERIPGNLVMNFGEDDRSVVGSPKERYLLHYTNTNLYYLQTQFRKQENLTFKDVCLTPQMTFTCDIQYAMDIIKEMVRDTKGKLQKNKKVSNMAMEVMQRLETCVNLLFDRQKMDRNQELTVLHVLQMRTVQVPLYHLQ